MRLLDSIGYDIIDFEFFSQSNNLADELENCRTRAETSSGLIIRLNFGQQKFLAHGDLNGIDIFINPQILMKIQ